MKNETTTVKMLTDSKYIANRQRSFNYAPTTNKIYKMWIISIKSTDAHILQYSVYMWHTAQWVWINKYKRIAEPLIKIIRWIVMKHYHEENCIFFNFFVKQMKCVFMYIWSNSLFVGAVDYTLLLKHPMADEAFKENAFIVFVWRCTIAHILSHFHMLFSTSAPPHLYIFNTFQVSHFMSSRVYSILFYSCVLLSHPFDCNISMYSHLDAIKFP